MNPPVTQHMGVSAHLLDPLTFTFTSVRVRIMRVQCGEGTAPDSDRLVTQSLFLVDMYGSVML